MQTYHKNGVERKRRSRDISRFYACTANLYLFLQISVAVFGFEEVGVAGRVGFFLIKIKHEHPNIMQSIQEFAYTT